MVQFMSLQNANRKFSDTEYAGIYFVIGSVHASSGDSSCGYQKSLSRPLLLVPLRSDCLFDCFVPGAAVSTVVCLICSIF
ncbi:hypothetical protein HanIR_Chr01g0013911 [Helianthus annuus]|nr:hypothetical protein HanIR_Chr01g0013911 [Helianthus annuus]